jgi:hypothetical protein
MDSGGPVMGAGNESRLKVRGLPAFDHFTRYNSDYFQLTFWAADNVRFFCVSRNFCSKVDT